MPGPFPPVMRDPASRFVVIRLHTSLVLWFLALSQGVGGCAQQPGVPADRMAATDLELLSFRVRRDADAGLNEDDGWAAAADTDVQLAYDRPFRIRVQVRSRSGSTRGESLSLRYRRPGDSWTSIAVADFPYPSFASPPTSVITINAYANGDETNRLLGDPGVEWDEGAGLNGVAATPAFNAGGDALEWEWPLVIRRFADGPTFHEDGEVFELQVVDSSGRGLAGVGGPRLTMTAEPNHLGGTFVETPGRLGPYQAADGTLYFFMEPTETDNRFMAVASTDHGRSWREVDGANRPVADDLEGVATTRVGNTVHIAHQVSRQVYHHAFDISGPGPGRWTIDSQTIATHGEPPTQFVDIAARRDGSLVVLYAGPERLFLTTRSPAGVWGSPRAIDAEVGPALSGPVIAAGEDDVVTLAYTGRDGRGFVRQLFPDGRLSARQLLSERFGVDDRENGAILPPVAMPDIGTTVIVYRESDGRLFERRLSGAGVLSEPFAVSVMPVVTNAVDSEQAGADVIQHDGTLHLVFIDEATRSIWYQSSSTPGVWSPPRRLLADIDAAWIRGSVHEDAQGRPVYGFVYDAGSRGGSGFNRYFALRL